MLSTVTLGTRTPKRQSTVVSYPFNFADSQGDREVEGSRLNGASRYRSHLPQIRCWRRQGDAATLSMRARLLQPAEAGVRSWPLPASKTNHLARASCPSPRRRPDPGGQPYAGAGAKFDAAVYADLYLRGQIGPPVTAGSLPRRSPNLKGTLVMTVWLLTLILNGTGMHMVVLPFEYPSLEACQTAYERRKGNSSPDWVCIEGSASAL